MKASILFFLKRNSTPETLACTTASLWAMHRLQVELRRADLDAEAFELVPGGLEQFRGMQQRLRRDAADVEAGAAERLALLDDGDLEAELGRLDRRRHSRRGRSR